MTVTRERPDPTSLTPEMAQALQQYPIAYIRLYLPELRLWSGVELILESVWKHQRTSVRACHGISKTWTAALVAVVFLNVFPNSVVVTSAPTFRQVEKLLWKEIGAFYRDYGSVLLGRPLLTEVKIQPDWYMFGFATDRPVAIEGLHAPAILWIIDEAKGMTKDFYNSMEGSMTGGFCRALEISTTDGAPQDSQLRLHHTTKTGRWNCIRLSAMDSPIVDPEDPDLEKYRRYINKDLFKYGRPERGTEWPVDLAAEIQIASKSWILDRRTDWEASEPETFKTKVWGEFSTVGEDFVIPMEWIDAAVNNTKVKANPAITKFGLDVAESGTDRSVLTERQGGFVFPTTDTTWQGLENMPLVGKVAAITKKRGVIQIDRIGVGAGPYSRLKELGHPIIGIWSGGKAIYDQDAYANLRAEMWWHTRAVFLRNYEEGNVLSIPDDPDLKGELAAMKYTTRSDGRILIEDKKQYVKRYGRSPDKADSLVYCLARLPDEVDDDIPEELKALLFRHFPDMP